MHITCGNILDVDLIRNDFIIKTTENYIFEIINNNKRQLKDCFESLGYNYEILVRKLVTKNEKVNQDIEKLKRLVGDYLKIKG